jgi:hypothetical protein
MGANSGFPNQQRLGSQAFQTIQELLGGQGASDVMSWFAFTVNGAIPLIALIDSTKRDILVAANTAKPGDWVQFLTGANAGVIIRVLTANATDITLNNDLPITPTAGDNFNIRRAVLPNVDAQGNQSVSVAPFSSTMTEFGTLDFSITPVTSLAFVALHTLVADCKQMQVTNQSGGAFKLAVNAVVVGVIVPGEDVIIPFARNAGDVLTIEALNAGYDTVAGNLFVNFFN